MERYQATRTWLKECGESQGRGVKGQPGHIRGTARSLVWMNHRMHLGRREEAGKYQGTMKGFKQSNDMFMFAFEKDHPDYKID